MPVKILNQGSDPRAGIIDKAEMDGAITEFQDDIIVRSTGTKEVSKTDFCEFKIGEILELLQITNASLPANVSAIRIYFGVHPEGQQSCEGEDYSNVVNTMIFAVDAQGNVLDQLNEQMLIPGYNSFGQGAGASCCGGMGPRRTSP